MDKDINITEEFADLICRLAARELPPDIVRKAKDCLLDYIGVSFAGGKIVERAFSAVYQDSDRKDGAPVIGRNRKTDAATACLMNGFHAHVLELDDGHRFGMIHPGAVIISALISAASVYPFNGTDFLRGMVMGYEAMARLAVSMQPGHKKRGFHATGTCGTIGAAVAVAVAIAMDRGQLKTVLSAAATSGSGLLEIIEDGSLKPYNVGNAAMNGFQSAQMGLTGFRGADDMLGGGRGFLYSLSDNPKPASLIAEKPYYEIERIYVKPYAACRHCHLAIDAAIQFHREGFDLDRIEEIEEIVIETYGLAIQGHDHNEIKGVQSAQMSIPYSIAAALVLGRGDFSAFTEQNIEDDTIIRLMKKVKIYENKEYSRLFKTKRIAEVKIITKKTQYIKRIDYAKGDPENPLTRKELEEKFKLLMMIADNLDKADDIMARIEEIDQIDAGLAAFIEIL